MVEIFVKPEWVSPVAIRLVGIALFLFSLGIVLELLKITRWTLHIFAASTIVFVLCLAIVLITGTGVFNVGKRLNNPLEVSEEYKSLAVMVPDEMENVILENTGADKVMLDEMSPMDLFEILANEDFAEFKALKNGQRIDGTLYFTEESMVINIAEEEEDNVEVIEVATN